MPSNYDQRLSSTGSASAGLQIATHGPGALQQPRTVRCTPQSFACMMLPDMVKKKLALGDEVGHRQTADRPTTAAAYYAPAAKPQPAKPKRKSGGRRDDDGKGRDGAGPPSLGGGGVLVVNMGAEEVAEDSESDKEVAEADAEEKLLPPSPGATIAPLALLQRGTKAAAASSAYEPNLEFFRSDVRLSSEKTSLQKVAILRPCPERGDADAVVRNAIETCVLHGVQKLKLGIDGYKREVVDLGALVCAAKFEWRECVDC
eukprot:g13699.t1